jgi:hypothetical protein
MKFISLVVIGLVLFALNGCYGSPFQKTSVQNDPSISRIEPLEGKVKLAVVRPYDYSYYGHAVDVLVNNVSQVSIPNQSFSVLNTSPGAIEVRGQSGLLGPPTKDIKIEGKSGEVIYLIWKTSTTPNYSSGIPIIGLHWQKVTKEEASIYLKNVEYVQPKNAIPN